MMAAEKEINAQATATPEHISTVCRKLVLEHVRSIGEWNESAWEGAKLSAMEVGAKRIAAKHRGGRKHYS